MCVFPISRLLKDVQTVKTDLFTYQSPTMPCHGFGSAELQPHPSLGMCCRSLYADAMTDL